jgi:hypothetical protein
MAASYDFIHTFIAGDFFTAAAGTTLTRFAPQATIGSSKPANTSQRRGCEAFITRCAAKTYNAIF